MKSIFFYFIQITIDRHLLENVVSLIFNLSAFLNHQHLCYMQHSLLHYKRKVYFYLLHLAVQIDGTVLSKLNIMGSICFGRPISCKQVFCVTLRNVMPYFCSFMPTVAKSIALRLYTEPGDSVRQYFLKALKQNLYLNDYGLWRSIDDPSVNQRLESKFSNLYYSLAKANAMIKFLSRFSDREDPTVIHDEKYGLSSRPSHDSFYERLATSDEEAFFNAIYMKPSGSATRSSSTLKETVQLPTPEAWNISQYPPHMYPHLSFFRNFSKKNMMDTHQGNDSFSYKNRFSRQSPSKSAYSKGGENNRGGSRYNRPQGRTTF